MDKADVDIVRRQTVWRGFLRVDKYTLRHRLHDGGWSEIVTREVVERGHAVAVVPYDPARDEIVLIDQFRIGALTAGLNPWVTELVAGMIGKGETAEGVAVRETREETGCEVIKLIKVCDYLSTPGAASEVVSLFCGLVDARAANGIHGNKDEGEDILVRTLCFDAAMDRLGRGEINNAISVIGLQWLAMNRARVRSMAATGPA